MKPILRLGIFGVGRMGRVHVDHLMERQHGGEIQLVAIGDRHQATLEATIDRVSHWSQRRGAEHGAANSSEYFTTPEAMAAEAQLDAVVVASRVSDHARDMRPFAARQIPMMVEKPITGSLSEVAELSNLLGERADELVFIAFQRYFDPAARSAMTWFQQGLIGDLQQSQHVIQDKNPTPVGYESGGITADMAVHLVFESMSFHGFELPRFVQALRFNAPYYEDRAQEGANIVHVFCTWDDGSLAHLWGSRLNATGYDNGFKLIGTLGRIDVGDFAGDFGDVTAKLWRGTGSGPIPRGTLCETSSFPMTPAAAGQPDFYPRFATAFDGELACFLQHVREATAFPLGLDVGWKTLLVASAAEASSQLGGQRLELLQSDGSPIRSAPQAASFGDTHGIP